MDGVLVSEVESFLNFLEPNAPFFTFCVLSDNGPVPSGGTRIEGIHDALNFIQSLNGSAANPTLHVTLNRTKASGRKTKEIEQARVLCIDLDRQLQSKEIRDIVDEFSAHLVVESSPGKYHVYWRISPSVSLATWSTFQLALAYYFDADRNLSQLAKTIRVPGIPRKTKSGEMFTPTIKYISDSIVELSYNDVTSLFPWINEKYEEAVQERKAEKKALKEAIAKATEGVNYNDQTPMLDALKAGLLGQGRNTTIYEHIKELTSSQVSKITSEEDALVEAMLLNGTFEEPLDERELEECALSGFNRGLEIRAWHLQKLEEEREKLTPARSENEKLDAVTASTPAQPGDPGSPSDFDYKPALLIRLDPFSDMSIVERVIQRYAGQILKIGGRLFAFDSEDSSWRPQKAESSEILASMVMNCCIDTMKHPDFIPKLCKGKTANIQRWTAHFLSNRTTSNTTRSVRNWKDYPKLEISDFDTDENKIYCSNGVLDMLSGELREVKASDRLLHRTPVSWVPGATCPWWEEFLGQLFSGKQVLIDFMQEVFGYSLSGCVDAQKLFIHYGSGCNGKSKVLDTLAMLAGEYTCRMTCNTFSKSKTGFQKEFERIGAKMEGKRVVVLDDLDTGGQWNEGFVKSLTSRYIMTRRLYEEERDVPNHAKVHIGCNEAPQPESENYGLLRRLCIIPYNVRFKPSVAKEEEIQCMTMRELPGILAWAVRGWQRLKTQGGLSEPEEVVASIEDYQANTFNVTEIIKQIFTVDGLNSEDWHDLQDLTALVNAELSKEGLQRVDARELGKVLSETFSCQKERGRREGKRARWYHVKILVEKASGQQSLIDKL